MNKNKKNNTKPKNKSFFIVNKLHKLIIFLFLSISDLTLGIGYFLISGIIYIYKLLTSTVPMHVNEEIEMHTYVYKKSDKKDLKIDIYYPNKSGDNHPLVYFCHGGGWISGFRDQPNNVSWCKFLASRGFIVSSIDYRYGYKNTMMDLLSDYNDGLLFLRVNSKRFKIDINNISLVGLSAGGHMALLYMTYLTYINDKVLSRGIKSVVSFYPPTNLNDLIEDEKSKSFIAIFGALATLKSKPSENQDIYEYYSPITWVSENMIPTLIAHGKEDDTVPFTSSINFVRELKKNNVPYEFLVHNTANHSFDTQLNDRKTINILEKTVYFINKHFK